MQVQQTNLPNDFLMERINASIPDPKARVYPITFCIRKNPSHVVADVEGYLMAGVLYTDQLWVDQRYRRQGLGKQLMYKMHTFGQSHSCSMATVCTMSSQHALPFLY